MSLMTWKNKDERKGFFHRRSEDKENYMAVQQFNPTRIWWTIGILCTVVLPGIVGGVVANDRRNADQHIDITNKISEGDRIVEDELNHTIERVEDKVERLEDKVDGIDDKLDGLMMEQRAMTESFFTAQTAILKELGEIKRGVR